MASTIRYSNNLYVATEDNYILSNAYGKDTLSTGSANIILFGENKTITTGSWTAAEGTPIVKFEFLYIKNTGNGTGSIEVATSNSSSTSFARLYPSQSIVIPCNYIRLQTYFLTSTGGTVTAKIVGVGSM